MRRVTQTARAKPQRRRAPSLWLRRARVAGFALGSIGLVGGAAYWLWSSGFAAATLAQASDRLLAFSAQSGLAVTAIEIEGRSETEPADILAAIGIAKDAPILTVDLEAARQRLIDLPWVTSAIVERRLPDRLVVHLTEAQPLALWQREGRYHLIGRDGEVIGIDDVAPFRNLLLLVGAEAPQSAAGLLALLETAPELKARVKAAVLVNGRRWSLRMDNGIEIKLPETDATAAWLRFADLERQHGLLGKDISIIDLRQPDKLTVRLAHPASGGGGDESAAPGTAKPKPTGQNET